MTSPSQRRAKRSPSLPDPQLYALVCNRLGFDPYSGTLSRKEYERVLDEVLLMAADLSLALSTLFVRPAIRV